MPISKEILQTIPFFKNLSHETIDSFSQTVNMRIFEDGEIIQLEADDAQSVYFLLIGQIRIYRSNPNGREQNLRQIKPGETINIPLAFTKKKTAKAHAAAIGEVRTICIRFTDLNQLIKQHPETTQILLSMLSNRIIDLTELTYDLSLRSVRSRLANFLLNHVSTENQSWTQADIAAQIGSVREVISRTLRSFVKEEIIELQRQKIVIINEKKLKEISQE